jgi:hypothetical protein
MFSLSFLQQLLLVADSQSVCLGTTDLRTEILVSNMATLNQLWRFKPILETFVKFK